MKIYLASPLFTELEKKNVKKVTQYLRSGGHSVYTPMEHHDVSYYPNNEWTQSAFEEEVNVIRNCDEVYCIYYGLYSDSGTSWVCGFAYGIGKPIKLIDQSDTEVSFFVVNSANNKEDFF